MEKNEYQKKYSLLKKKLEEIGFICTGSITSVYNKCGNPNCHCHKDKNALHGPYNVWTRKVKGKTVTRNLSDDQARLCRECIENMRTVEDILEKMKELSVLYIEDYKNALPILKNKGKV